MRLMLFNAPDSLINVQVDNFRSQKKNYNIIQIEKRYMTDIPEFCKKKNIKVSTKFTTIPGTGKDINNPLSNQDN